MRLTATVAGVFLCAVIFSANTQIASAEIENDKLILGQISLDEAVDNEFKTTGKPVKIVKKTVKHSITKGETLVKISDKYKVDWKRIYDKNTEIADPDVINPGEKLVIPDKKEKLKERKIAADKIEAKVEIKPEANNSFNSRTDNSARTSSSSSYTSARGSSSGNTYSPGYCTYYAKQMRPDLPNNLGNAETWVSRARAQGIPTGSTPRVGAIGQKGNHVVYVQKINSNGTIVISEMNWTGLWNISTRTVSANSHIYIY
jgi:surface antigen